MLIGGFLRLGCDGIHGRSSLVGCAGVAAMIAEGNAARC
jgi:hypothetical protein